MIKNKNSLVVKNRTVNPLNKESSQLHSSVDLLPNFVVIDAMINNEFSSPMKYYVRATTGQPNLI